MNPRRAICSLTVLLMACAPLALAQGTYTQIDVPGAVQTSTWGINTVGDISGNYLDASGVWHGFLASRGTYLTIDYPGASSTYLYGMNDMAQILGQTSQSIGFLYDVKSQTFTEIVYPGATITIPIAINNAGAVAGYVQVDASQGFELQGSSFRRIAPPSAVEASVFGITSAGELVGNFQTPRAPFAKFAFNGGQYHLLPIRNALKAEIFGVNATGTALVGRYRPTAQGFSGFVFENNIFQPLQFPGSNYTTATGINSSGEVVGYFLGSDNISHGFTWTPPADAAKKETGLWKSY